MARTAAAPDLLQTSANILNGGLRPHPTMSPTKDHVPPISPRRKHGATPESQKSPSKRRRSSTIVVAMPGTEKAIRKAEILPTNPTSRLKRSNKAKTDRKQNKARGDAFGYIPNSPEKDKKAAGKTTEVLTSQGRDQDVTKPKRGPGRPRKNAILSEKTMVSDPTILIDEAEVVDVERETRSASRTNDVADKPLGTEAHPNEEASTEPVRSTSNNQKASGTQRRTISNEEAEGNDKTGNQASSIQKTTGSTSDKRLKATENPIPTRASAFGRPVSQDDRDYENTPAEPDDDDSSEDESIASAQNSEFELFGCGSQWENVKKEAKETRRGRRSLQTDAIEDITGLISEARQYYRRLRDEELNEIEISNIENNLQASLADLRLEVSAVSEHEAGTEKRETIEDILRHGVPALVELIRAALDARRAKYSIPGKINKLREVVEVQRIARTLCERAKAWKAKPLEEKYKARITRKLYPDLRHMHDAFQSELNNRRRIKKVAVQSKRLREDYRRIDEKWMQEEEERQIRQADNRRQQMTSLARNVDPAKPAMHETNQWDREMETELLDQLKRFGDQPGEQRYFSCLNTPLLQNKLPEHIRAKALELKPFGIETCQIMGVAAPQWLQSIE